MRVKCILTDISNQAYAKDDRVFAQSDDGLLELDIGREYMVYALEMMYGLDWVYVLPQGQDIPLRYPAAVFSVADGSIPDEWIYEIRQENGLSRSLLSFPSWSGDGSYYERLLDRESSALSVFLLERVRLAKREEILDAPPPKSDSGLLESLTWGNQDLLVFRNELVLLDSDRLVSTLKSPEAIERIVFASGDPWIEYVNGGRSVLRVDTAGGLELTE